MHAVVRAAQQQVQAEESKDFLDRVADVLTDSVFLGTVGILAGALLVWMLIARLGHRAAGRLADRRVADLGEVEAVETRQRIETLWVVIRRVGLVAVLVVTTLTLMAWWKLPIAPFLAVGSLVAVAIGFGAQSLVKDIIAGFFIISENQFSIGDVVRIGDAVGAVQDIRLRVTVLRDLEGNVFYVPNGVITVTENRTQERASVVVDVGVAYHEQVDRVIEVLRDEVTVFSQDPDWAHFFLEEPQILGVNALADWSVNVRVVFTVRPDDRWTAKREFLRRVKNRLDAEGIEIPFPYRTLVPGEGWREALGPI